MMSTLRSLVFRNLPKDLSTPLTRTRVPQEFVRDEVLVTPGRDPYEQVARAKEIIASGKSLAVESGAFGVEPARKSW